MRSHLLGDTSCPLGFGHFSVGRCPRNEKLAQGFQSLCNLIQRLLNALQFSLSGIGKLLDALRRALQMTSQAADDLTAFFTDEEYSEATQKHS